MYEDWTLDGPFPGPWWLSLILWVVCTAAFFGVLFLIVGAASAFGDWQHKRQSGKDASAIEDLYNSGVPRRIDRD